MVLFFLGEEKASNFKKRGAVFSTFDLRHRSKLRPHLGVTTFPRSSENFFLSGLGIFVLWAAVLDYLDEKATKSTPKKRGIFDLRI